MARIFVLSRKTQSTRIVEELNSSLEDGSRPHLMATIHDVDVYGQAVVVCRLSGWSSSRSPLQESLIKNLLFLESAGATVIIELDCDVFHGCVPEPLEDYWTESIVEPSEAS